MTGAGPTYDRWIAALRGGALMAGRCPRCGGVWLPPRPICPVDHAVPEWIHLSGEGVVEIAVASPGTGGAPAVYARVRIDGAGTHLCGLVETRGGVPPAAGARVRITATEDSEPQGEGPGDAVRAADPPAGRARAAWRFTPVTGEPA